MSRRPWTLDSRTALEPTAGEMRALAAATSERVIAHLDRLAEQPACDLEGADEIARALVEPIPRRPEAWETLLDEVLDSYVPKSINTASPGIFSYIQGGGLFHAALADFVSLAVNRYVGYRGASPALADLESTVVRWFADMIGFPATAGGVLTTGGSLGNLMAVVAARSERLGEDFRRARLYASDQVHHSIGKAALIAGLPAASLRIVPSDELFRVDVRAMAEMIDADRASGLEPFMIVGSAGTTNTGAIDDLAGLSELAASQKTWFHVDAAYGGFFALTDRGKRALGGIASADSVVLDPHKSLFLPYGTGALVARDVETLRRSHEMRSDYVEEVASDGAVNFADISPELTRDFRGLRVWLPLKALGADAFRDCLDEKLDLARYAADRLRNVDGIELVAEPQLSTLAFRVARAGATAAECDAETLELMSRVNALARVHLSSTAVRGRPVVRVCVLSFRAHREQVDGCIDDIETVRAGM